MNPAVESDRPTRPHVELDGGFLLRVARHCVEAALGMSQVVPLDLSALRTHGACFVTIRFQDTNELHGCIGSTRAHRPLGQDIRANAEAAALRDPRSRPLTRQELDQVRFEVSVLGPSTPFPVRSEQDALDGLRPGQDGVILRYGPRRAALLPQAWEQLPDPHLFLARLKRKAGLLPKFWHPDIDLERFEVQSWRE